MTIPDLGHCAGSGASPIDGTVSDGEGVCAACSGRFELRDDGSLSLHEAAAVDEREAVPADDD